MRLIANLNRSEPRVLGSEVRAPLSRSPKSLLQKSDPSQVPAVYVLKRLELSEYRPLKSAIDPLGARSTSRIDSRHRGWHFCTRLLSNPKDRRTDWLSEPRVYGLRSIPAATPERTSWRN